MKKLLYEAIKKSNKTLNNIAQHLQCSEDELVDKILEYDHFTTDEINSLTNYIPLNNPIEIFFDSRVHHK